MLAGAWGATVVVAGVLFYRWRDSVLKACGVIVGASGALAVSFLLTGPSLTYIFEQAAARFMGTVIVGVISAAGVAHVLPRLNGGPARRNGLVLCMIVAAMYSAVGLSLWRVADDGLELAGLPVAQTRDDVLAWRAQPSRRIFGILFAARLGDLPADSSPSASTAPTMFLTCRDGFRLGSSAEPYFPSLFTVTLTDDSTALVQGITSVRQAEGWPRTGRRMDECGLSDGDPVVIWGDPGATREFGSDRPNPAINSVRIIAYGDVAEFRRTVGAAAGRTGRAALALAVLNGGLAIAATVRGVTIYRRRESDDDTGDSQV